MSYTAEDFRRLARRQELMLAVADSAVDYHMSEDDVRVIRQALRIAARVMEPGYLEAAAEGNEAMAWSARIALTQPVDWEKPLSEPPKPSP